MTVVRYLVLTLGCVHTGGNFAYKMVVHVPELMWHGIKFNSDKQSA
jgi:hypothetical protein